MSAGGHTAGPYTLDTMGFDGLPRIAEKATGRAICAFNKVGRGVEGERVAFANARMTLAALESHADLVAALEQAASLFTIQTPAGFVDMDEHQIERTMGIRAAQVAAVVRAALDKAVGR